MNNNIAKAVRLYEKAMILIEEAQGIFEAEGIMVDEPCSNYDRGKEEWEAQCYSGIKNFESEAKKVKDMDMPPMFKGHEERKNVGHIKVGKINFFQLKDVKDDGLYLK